MINWDELPWADLSEEELAEFEEELADQVIDLVFMRKAEQLLTGQEP